MHPESRAKSLGCVDILVMIACMSNVKLPAEQWDRILDFLRGCAGLYVAQEEDCQRFVEAVLWINRSGAQWRLLPAEYGNWNSVYKRFAPLG